MAAMDIESTLPWVEKYRPNTLRDLVSHTSIVNTIQRFVSTKRLPHMLFYGPPGTGKTSTILAVAREMYGKAYNIMALELNASDDRGINVVREQIKSFASTQHLVNRGVKLVVLDEADSMTNAAQFALRRIIEKYTRSTRFCLICNYASKIIPALQSRCTRFRFMPLNKEDAMGRLREIAAAEGLDLTDSGVNAITELGRGDMRKCLNIMQSTSMAFTQIDDTSVYNSTGCPQPAVIDTMIQNLLTGSFAECNDAVTSAKLGLNLSDLIREIHACIMKIDFPDKMKIFLVKRLCELEVRLATGSSEKLQTASMIGGFVEARQITS